MPQGDDDAGHPSAVLLAMKRSASGSRREEKRQQLQAEREAGRGEGRGGQLCQGN